MSAYTRLRELGLELPPAGKALGMYKPVVVVGGLAYLSGHGPVAADGTAICGRLGEDLDQAAGYEAARRAGLAVLATLGGYFGDHISWIKGLDADTPLIGIDHVRRLVKTVGFVQATPEFTAHPAVINGFSELMRDVFGPEAGVGARSALGVASLPAGWAVEIETVFELQPD
jgi:enamine deaminase RidA (YjgF/YER057c/UK114 family)